MKPTPEKIYLRNILNRDFSVTYDIHGDGRPVTYTILAQDVKGFEPIIGEHMRKHLANEILNGRGIKTNWEDEIQTIYKEITVDL